MSVTDRQLAPRPVVLVGLAGADESAGSCAPTVESLTIGDATSGVITFRNDADSRPGAAIDLAITGEFALDKTTIGPLGPGETEAVTVTVTAVGAQIGVLTATTSGGEVAVSVSSSLSHVPSAIAGLVDAYDARLLDGVTDGAIVTAAFGGPNAYAGRALGAAHAGLLDRGMNDGHFDAVVGHLGATLSQLGVARELIEEAAGVAESVRGAVMGRA